MLRSLGRHDEAIRAEQREIEHWRRLTRENPEVPLFRARLYSSSARPGSFPDRRGPKARGGRVVRAGGPGARGPAAEDRRRPVQPGLRSGPRGRRDRRATGRFDGRGHPGARPADRRRDGCAAPVDGDCSRDRRAHAGRPGPGNPPRPRRLPGAACPQESGRRSGAGSVGGDPPRPRRSSRPIRRRRRRGPNWPTKRRATAATAPTWPPASTPSARSSPTSGDSTRPRKP